MQRRKIASLDVLEVPAPSESVNGPVILLLHGYGASAHDLFPLHQELQSPPGTSWYFPNGPVKVPLGPNMYGRAWFPINIAALEEALAQGNFRDLSPIIPKGLPEAREQIIQTIEQIAEEKQIGYDKIIIGGFSQGAMLATDIVLRNTENFAKLLILSGTLLAQEEWSKLALSKKGLPFFQSHGKEDPLLPFAMAEELHSILSRAGCLGKLSSFTGGHEIPPIVLSQLESFLLSPN